MNPEFGCDLKKFLFEGITESNINALKISIEDSISIYIPEIIVKKIAVDSNIDYNSIDLTVEYSLKISQTPDQVTVQFT